MVSDAVLSLLVDAKPTSLASFAAVEGVTTLAADSYGARFVRVIADWAVAASSTAQPSEGAEQAIDLPMLLMGATEAVGKITDGDALAYYYHQYHTLQVPAETIAANPYAKVSNKPRKPVKTDTVRALPGRIAPPKP